MSTSLLDGAPQLPAVGGADAGVPAAPTYGRLNRMVFYVPRFRRHLRRRLRSHMTLPEALHSTRMRMRDYR